MNVPNALSLLRLVITFFFILAVDAGRFHLALGLFVVQAATDLLDGLIARTTGSKTRLGAFLDPLADKTMLLSAFLVLAMKDIVPLWICATIFIRDLILLIGFLILYRLRVQEKPLPSMWGKINNGLQMFTVMYLLWDESRSYSSLFFYPTVFFTVSSGAHYVIRATRTLMHRETA
jgi:cardiolipin synthase (CMP-forming)